MSQPIDHLKDHTGNCVLCGNECCSLVEVEAESDGPTLITPEELDPANWEITYFKTDCGSPCTPDGCQGHTTPIVDYITIGGYHVSLPVDDMVGDIDWSNIKSIGNKIKEVIEFYAKHHPKTQAEQSPDRAAALHQ